MADDYFFKEAFSDAKKIRRALEVGTDGNNNPILRPVVASGEDQTGDPITFVATNDGRQLQALELDDGQGTTGRITRTETAQDVAGHALDQNGALRAIEVVDDGSGNYLLNTNIANQISASIDEQTADLATQTTLASAAQVLSNAEDGDGDAFDVNIDGQSAGLAQDSSVHNLAFYSGDPNTYDLSAAPHTVNCDAFQVPDGSNAVQDVQITTPNSTQRTITVPTNAIIPQQVTSFDGGGSASTVTVFNQ